MTELKPCPFCGSKPIGPEIKDIYTHHTSWWIECESCGIVMDRGSKNQLITDWNTRKFYRASVEDGKAILCTKKTSCEALNELYDACKYCGYNPLST